MRHKHVRTTLFDQWALNLRRTLPRVKVRHERERKTVCVSVNTDITEVLSFQTNTWAYRATHEVKL